MTTLARCCVCSFIIITHWCSTVSAQLVDIPDPNLKQAIRETLNLPDESPITQTEMLRLTRLEAPEKKIKDLTGLEHAINLKRIDVHRNNISNLKSLADLTQLEHLSLWGNPISDLSPLANLTQLRGLDLGGCQVSDITPLANLTQLESLHLHINRIEDIALLANLTQLADLWLQSNQISDIMPLARLTQLTELALSYNRIVDVSPLANLVNLIDLKIAGNSIRDFSPLLELNLKNIDIDIHMLQELASVEVEIFDPNLERAIREKLSLPDEIPLTQLAMKQLTELNAGNSQIENLTGLEHAINLKDLRLCVNQIRDLRPLSGLVHLEHLSLCANQISDISSLENLTNLKKLDLGGNGKIADITALENLTQLELIFLRDNSVEDISILANLTQLTVLQLDKNQIRDITPLANLTLLEKLWLNRNAITDITPLIGLKNLKELYLADNPFHDFSPLLELEEVELDIEISEGFNVVVEIPDPNLRQLIRETLSLPEAVPLTQQQILRLTRLDADGDRGIADLVGLEYATNLKSLGLYRNPIGDISLLAHLTKLEGVNLTGCHIVDLSPLRNLNNLRGLFLGYNKISDVSPLAELTNLTFLHLQSNQIVDFSPLANLVSPQELWINHNFGTDISPLAHLNLADFRYDEVCDIESLPPLVKERIENRSFPSIFQAWDDVVGLDYLTWEQRNVLHDLYWSANFGLNWDTTLAEPTYGVATQRAGYLEGVRETRQRRLAQNPNMIFLHSIRIHNHKSTEAFPPNSDFWLRDAQGQIVRTSANEYLFNFLKPEVQELLAERIIAIARCGLYDGVMLDDFNRNGTRFLGWKHFYPVTDEEIIQAHLNIFRVVRSQVRDDFLIVINTNRSKATRYAEYVNGTFMETGTDYLGGVHGGYTHDGLAKIESTLSWSEENLRSPQINCLEGWGIPTEPPDSPSNRRWMRVFTTMSLTHSDGYVMYNTGRGVIRLPDPGDGYPNEPGHEHIWYPFWDADLGRPIDPKAQQYQNIPGLFIREFTNGWAVYNRSGTAQEISLAEDTTGVASGQTGRKHQLADLDGEIYLRAGTRPAPTDINGDGVVNILDLILVAQNFGTTKSDINGDGTTNILDLILVAQHLGETSTAAAPASLPVSLSPETVQAWIDMAHAQNDGSVAFAQGIAMLERLLALMIPDKTVLRANYPNPFNPETWIPYHLASDTEVRINIYDIQGVLVRQFNLGHQKAGYYTDRGKAAYWDGRNEIGESVASGVYFYTLTTDDYTGTRRMTIIK